VFENHSIWLLRIAGSALSHLPSHTANNLTMARFVPVARGASLGRLASLLEPWNSILFGEEPTRSVVRVSGVNYFFGLTTTISPYRALPHKKCYSSQ